MLSIEIDLEAYQILIRAAWQHFAEDYIESAEKVWQLDDPCWGIWQLTEAELELVPNDLKGKFRSASMSLSFRDPRSPCEFDYVLHAKDHRNLRPLR